MLYSLQEDDVVDDKPKVEITNLRKYDIERKNAFVVKIFSSL